MCFLPENNSSSKKRDSLTTQNSARNARPRGVAAKCSVESKRMSYVPNVVATQLFRLSRLKANLYCAGRASQTDQKLRILPLRSEAGRFCISSWSDIKMAELSKFAHRSNLDGTMDTICTRCITTVATVYEEGELLRHEQQHICDPVLVERFDGMKPLSETVGTSKTGKT